MWGDLMSLGLVFPVAIVLGFFGGRWVGGWFGHPLPGQWIGLIYGIATGFWELYKVSRKLERMDPPAPPTPPTDDDPKDKRDELH
jgi:Putative F0F1-ATPase subunit Ca2+/Mg2+ transporter